jgi:Family of unknown function (DUF6152)
MQNRLLGLCVLSVALLSFCGTALAHHGTPAYEDKITEFKQAKIAKFGWANPHALIVFDAKYPDGRPVHMVCETAAPQALRLVGWSKESLMPGDVVTVRMYVSKNGNPAGRLNKIILADGSELHDTVLGGDAGGKASYRPEDAASSPKQ